MTKDRNRPLVLRNEAARHPLRLSLPVAALAVSQEEIVRPAPKKRWLNEDVHMFLLSFIAFFTAFYLFIF